jgi:hypothetical protein
MILLTHFVGVTASAIWTPSLLWIGNLVAVLDD